MMRSIGLASSVFVFAFLCLLGVLPGQAVPGTTATDGVSGHTLAQAVRPGQFGVRVNDLTDAQRQRLERNTGAVVIKVYENTPAFFANILVGDVIIAVNGVPVGTAADAVAKLRAIDQSAGPATVTVIRRGAKKTITVRFNRSS